MQMLEKEIIQENGFRNVRKNGQIAGFQVGYRSCYYRSVWLSMSLGFDVTVDAPAPPERYPGSPPARKPGGLRRVHCLVDGSRRRQIGRASCRERVEISVVGG